MPCTGSGLMLVLEVAGHAMDIQLDLMMEPSNSMEQHLGDHPFLLPSEVTPCPCSWYKQDGCCPHDNP